jgi:CDP-diacylglycerol--serine O-phosphatidyltransferase
MGLWAIVFIAREQMVSAVVCIAIALVLDFFDGFVARLLNAQSEIGVQLDSLADAITFGIVPGLMVFQMIVITEGFYFVDVTKWPLWLMAEASVAGMLPLAAVYRLAKFNVTTEKLPHFKGLPTPAMTMFIVSIPLLLEMNYHLNFYHPLSENFIDMLGEVRRWDASDLWVVNLMFQPLTYVLVSVLLGGLMVSNIPMLSLKFEGPSWRQNKWRYALLIWAVVCYIIFVIPYIWSLPFSYGLIDYLILPIFMLGYFLLSFIYATFGAAKQTTDEV